MLNLPLCPLKALVCKSWRMLSRCSLLQLVLALGVILPPATDSQGTESYTRLPPVDWDEHLFTENLTAAAATIHSITAGASDPLDTATPSVIPRGFDDRAMSTVSPLTEEPITTSTDCVCDLTPDFCDIACCCDVVDCGVANLSSVFSGCKQETRPGVCVESWLMFRANVDPQLVTVTDSLFCVRKGNETDAAQTLPALSEGTFSIFSPHFSLQEPAPYHSRNSSFYKVDDIILTYYNATSAVSVLRHPSPGAASSSCVDRNPAKFLRSGSLSCSRAVSAQSCGRDGTLSIRSYFTGFRLLRVPRLSKVDLPNITIPVILLSSQPEPTEHNGYCVNVVSKVEYMITYTGGGEITAATLRVELANASFGTQLLQQHTVKFQLATPSPPPSSTPLVGLTVGTPVIGWFGEEAQPLTVQGLSVGGDCATDLFNRASILFNHNTITGCSFRSPSRDCASLKAQLYRVLRGATTPDMVAMTAGSQPDWSRVILQDCPEPPTGELCETGCLLPISLSVQVLWAQRGLLAMPQNHILGAKYIFSCQILKCPVASPLPVTTEVIFSDATVYPEAPRGEPQPEWKFPFAFFTRGAGELDGE
ncbi:tectonic-3 isoform X2 [Pygocentrus nattereri]|uniref:Tectonic domain-containing protein n=1 Tax=Pygocentrus nattereri TaxID=42514 RepID=A0AAR2JE57_PYGNA|nr:tectonic-3 isoform X2 [Pygocentrus nattereri]